MAWARGGILELSPTLSLRTFFDLFAPNTETLCDKGHNFNLRLHRRMVCLEISTTGTRAPGLHGFLLLYSCSYQLSF